VTAARFEVRIPESSSRIQPGTPTPQRQAQTPRPLTTTPVPVPQQTRSPAITPSTRQHPEPSPAAAATPCSSGEPHQPTCANPSVVEKPNSNHQRGPIPSAVTTSSSRPVATPRRIESAEAPQQPKMTPIVQPKTNPASQQRVPNVPRSTSMTERPWKRARTATLSEAQILENEICDIEYTMEVSTAQVNLYTRKLKMQRETEDDVKTDVTRI
jgi:hypothetical protein